MLNIMKKTVLILLNFVLFALSTAMMGQHLDVQGHSRIIGNLEICHMEDSSSLNLGVGAGINTIYAGNRTNTFVGFRAGEGNSAGSANTFIGSSAGRDNVDGVSNTYVGSAAGSSSTSGSHNAFFGALAGTQNISGKDNSFFGSSTGLLNTTGKDNAFFGSKAGLFNVDGSRNSFFGSGAGHRNTSGQDNSFFGAAAGSNNVSGSANVHMGFLSGHRSDGSNNTFIGHFSAEQNVSGDANVFVGQFVGFTNTTGSNNTLVGAEADVLSSDLENATAIGYRARVDASNEIRLGNTFITRIEGQVPFSSGSDQRLKESIKPIAVGMDFISDLNPVIYHRKSNQAPDQEMGLIAQEILASLHKFGLENTGSVYKGTDGYYSVRYNDLFAPIIKALQGLNEQLILLKNEHRDLNKMDAPCICSPPASK